MAETDKISITYIPLTLKGYILNQERPNGKDCLSAFFNSTNTPKLG
jgi:hypothetical protein